jgi:exopolyphosphatase / guanosine-5'-triphosphate,3'-diphosphate pyrophosphatase
VIERVAAIDCGTNAIRLLIAEVGDGERPREVIREMRTVRLGEGVDRTGEFSDVALARTFDACREYASLLNSFGVTRLRFIATSASRDVANRAKFIGGVESILNVQPEVISGREEAKLSYLGAISGFNPEPDSPILVADIGGGSTEFVMREASGVFVAQSINVGCVRMTERHLHSDPPNRFEINETISTLHDELRVVRNHLPITSTSTFIGLAGSVTTIAAMSLGLATYDPRKIHGSVLSLSQVEGVTEQLLTMPRHERAALGFMHPGRVDVIGGGALVLRESMRELELNHVLVSEHDLLDGVVSELGFAG